jgi:Flp pilus assembly protein CpaB
VISTGIHRRRLGDGLRRLVEASCALREACFLGISAGLIAALKLALRASRNEKRNRVAARIRGVLFGDCKTAQARVPVLLKMSWPTETGE